jgi:hypothetical protein
MCRDTPHKAVLKAQQVNKSDGNYLRLGRSTIVLVATLGPWRPVAAARRRTIDSLRIGFVFGTTPKRWFLEK